MSDIFKKNFSPLHPNNSAKILEIKETAEKLYELFNLANRETSVAKTKLEEAVMWAVKGVVNFDEAGCSEPQPQ